MPDRKLPGMDPATAQALVAIAAREFVSRAQERLAQAG